MDATVPLCHKMYSFHSDCHLVCSDALFAALVEGEGTLHAVSGAAVDSAPRILLHRDFSPGMETAEQQKNTRGSMLV